MNARSRTSRAGLTSLVDLTVRSPPHCLPFPSFSSTGHRIGLYHARRVATSSSTMNAHLHARSVCSLPHVLPHGARFAVLPSPFQGNSACLADCATQQTRCLERCDRALTRCIDVLGTPSAGTADSGSLTPAVATTSNGPIAPVSSPVSQPLTATTSSGQRDCDVCGF